MENRMKDQGMISWSEIVTENTTATIAFYKNVFGYESNDMQMSDGSTYTLLKVPTHSKDVIGIFKPTGKITDVSKIYFVVDDVNECEKKALTLGGSVVKTTFEMGSFCRMSILKDDAGYVFGITSFSDEALKDYDPAVDNAGRTQGIVGWFDVLSQDIDKALAFYTGLFGYTPKEYPDAGERYVMLESEHAKYGSLGGVAQMSEDTKKQLGSRYIQQYISVNNLEKANAAVKANGGTVVVEKIEIPEVGFFSALTDNNGNAVSAFQHTN